MKTRIASPFLFVPVSADFIGAVAAAAGLSDFHPTSCEQDAGGVSISANRLLAPAEKAAVAAVLMQSIFQITDE